MTQAEEQQITPFIEASNEPSKPIRAAASDDISVSAIVYTSASQWVVWINGHKLRPQHQEGDGFHLQNVEPMNITLTLSNHPGTMFHLSPGERLTRATGQIID